MPISAQSWVGPITDEWSERVARDGEPTHTLLSFTCCESENGSEGIFELLIRSKKAAKVGCMVERGGEGRGLSPKHRMDGRSFSALSEH